MPVTYEFRATKKADGSEIFADLFDDLQDRAPADVAWTIAVAMQAHPLAVGLAPEEIDVQLKPLE